MLSQQKPEGCRVYLQLRTYSSVPITPYAYEAPDAAKALQACKASEVAHPSCHIWCPVSDLGSLGNERVRA